MERDDRPFYALAALAGLVLVAFALPSTRGWLADEMLSPLQGQADPGHATRIGYTTTSLALWALAGAVLAWAAYAIVFQRLGYEPDRAFFLALAPYLLAGPLAHALLVAGAFAPGSALAYAATEPTIYLTMAILACAGLALGRAARQPFWAPFGLGALVALALLPFAAMRATAHGALLFAALVAVAGLVAAAVAWSYQKARPGQESFVAVLAVVGAHALDGLTTWMVLRDPFHVGFTGFGEKNPFSLALVGLSNGWPYFVVKLALPLVLLSLVKTEPHQQRQKAFLLFAIFVLGYGPGMGNALQVMLAG